MSPGQEATPVGSRADTSGNYLAIVMAGRATIVTTQPSSTCAARCRFTLPAMTPDERGSGLFRKSQEEGAHVRPCARVGGGDDLDSVRQDRLIRGRAGDRVVTCRHFGEGDGGPVQLTQPRGRKGA